MSLPFTSYAAIEAKTGLLSRQLTLDPDRSSAAEAWALRQTQAWLLTVLEGSTLQSFAGEDDSRVRYGSEELHAKLLLGELEAFWDGRATDEDNGVDVLVRDVAKTLAETRYLQELGAFDGKTGSSQFHLRKNCRSEVEETKLRVYSAGKLDVDATGFRYFRVRRFREL